MATEQFLLYELVLVLSRVLGSASTEAENVYAFTAF